jgi:hypothetical protein
VKIEMVVEAQIAETEVSQEDTDLERSAAHEMMVARDHDTYLTLFPSST